MTEAEIFQAIDYMVQCLPEDRELLIDSIWNSEEIRELIIETARDTIETVLEKLQVALQKVAEREPRIINLAVHSEFASLQSSVNLTVIPPKA